MKLIIDTEPRYYKNMQSDVKELYYEAINRITEAVRHGTPYEEKPQGDLISRDYVEKIVISEMVDLQDGTEIWRNYVDDTCESILTKVHNAPAVEPKRPQGEWIGVGKDVTGQYFYDESMCNQCFVVVTDKSNFCPNCGADMRGAKNEADN